MTMTIFLAILAPTLGFMGIFGGVAINEWLRRRNRREQFAQIVFEKRLAAYEELLARINQGAHIVDQFLTNDMTAEQRHEIVSTAIFGVIDFTDKNELYLDEEISLHCSALFMGTEDIPEAPEAEQSALKQKYYDMRKDAVRMITEDSGVAEINSMFKAVNRPKISSDIIHYYRSLIAERAP